MTYLILINNDAFYTNWFDRENNWIEGMTVFNLRTHEWTNDGINWYDIKQDHL